MKKIGLRFEIPNKQGKLIADILEPIECNDYTWHIGDNEIYPVINNDLSDDTLFKQNIVDGAEFLNTINDNNYYVIFAEFKATNKNIVSTEISCYEEFVNSNYNFIVLIADCSYVYIYIKNTSLIENIFNNANTKEYENIKYIYEDDIKNNKYFFK